jgi:hypothetical protein
LRKSQERVAYLRAALGGSTTMASNEGSNPPNPPTPSVNIPAPSTTEPTIDAKVNAKPISGPAAGAKKKKDKGEKGGEKGEKGGDKGAIVDDDKEQRRRPGMILTEPVKGTRDFTPDEMRVRNWLFGHWKYVFSL